jgi:hypothetical protein
MNYDLATADELVAEAREARRRAEETARTYGWAAQQQDAAVKRSIAVPINMSAVDPEALQQHYRVASARRAIDREAEASGLAAQWRADDQRAQRSQEAEAELAKYWSSLEGSGALGRLMSGKIDPELHAADIDQRKGKRS